jgi:hypothetical protein
VADLGEDRTLLEEEIEPSNPVFAELAVISGPSIANR